MCIVNASNIFKPMSFSGSSHDFGRRTKPTVTLLKEVQRTKHNEACERTAFAKMLGMHQ
jgi:hypothetical protein